MVGKDLIMATLFGSGGGSSGSGGGFKMTSGSVSFADNLDITAPNYYAVEHGLGAAPDLIFFTQDANNPTGGSNHLKSGIVYRAPDTGVYRYQVFMGNYDRSFNNMPSNSVALPTDKVFYMGYFHSTSTVTMCTYDPYIWYAFKWEE